MVRSSSRPPLPAQNPAAPAKYAMKNCPVLPCSRVPTLGRGVPQPRQMFLKHIPSHPSPRRNGPPAPPWGLPAPPPKRRPASRAMHPTSTHSRFPNTQRQACPCPVTVETYSVCVVLKTPKFSTKALLPFFRVGMGWRKSLTNEDGTERGSFNTDYKEKPPPNSTPPGFYSGLFFPNRPALNKFGPGSSRDSKTYTKRALVVAAPGLQQNLSCDLIPRSPSPGGGRGHANHADAR